ncbi:MAG: type VI secretion system-associated FHA domain protein TagH [Hyphomicrobiales bacterium]|nr:type VI secretion system-associated FHA domain protein TagH [Hyphomicrobiales bacterium]
MTLRLSIENVDRLPDGGPIRIEVKGRGLDLGRDSHLDWTLPDPGRSISGKHCEIRYRDGGYWLHDVSTNGTFVNGADYRLDAPYLLRDGDRLNIGPYIIAVAVEEGRKQRSQAAPAEVALDPDLANVWAPAGEAAAPEIGAKRQTAQPRGAAPDFLDFASFLEAPELGPEASPGPLRSEDDWLTAPRPVSPPPPLDQGGFEPRIPTPARPAIVDPAPNRPLPREPQPDSAAALEILDRIARAAGVPSGAFSSRNPDELADEIGAVLRMMAENLGQMLASRAESKTLMRSSSRTMIRPVENNPLKFASSPGEALGIMFGPRTRNYLDAQTTIERSFGDLKTHQILTYSAMQGALDALFEDLAPERIDHSVERENGLGALISSRKAKLWDIYVERWRSKTKRSDGRLLEAFIALFAQAYDKLQDKDN